MASDFCNGLLARAKSECRRAVAAHQIDQYHNEGDAGRLWKCHRGGSSTYHFWVSAPPGWLMCYGDMGECMWSRTRDMIAFVRGSAGSLDYFSEKVARDVKIREIYSELVEEWFSDVLIDWKENHGEKPSKQIRNKVAGLREWWDDYNDPVGLRTEIYESGIFSDCEWIPTFEFYSYQYLWRVEALKWFVETLDAGKVNKVDWSWTS